MSLLSSKLRSAEDGSGGRKLLFYCPGCKRCHGVNIGTGPAPRWTWDGSLEEPTFHPSVLVTWKEPSDNPDEYCDPSKDINKVCHSFVRQGEISFLGDCTHELASQTVPLPVLPGYLAQP